MYAFWVLVHLVGASCEGVAICSESADSCEVVITSCDAPVSLEACLDEGSVAGSLESEEWAGVLGCSTDVSLGWPATVDVDREELGWSL
jgi:hypothetical protein